MPPEVAPPWTDAGFRSLIEEAPCIVLCLDEEHRIVGFNREAEILYGRKREEVLGGDYIQSFLPPGVRDAVRQDIRKVIAGQPTRGFLNPVIAHDGRERVISWSVNRLPASEGFPSGIVAFGQDVTDRRDVEVLLEAESEIERQHSLLRELVEQRTAELAGANLRLQIEMSERKQAEQVARTLLDAIPDAAILMRTDGTILDCNRTVSERLSVPLDRLIGANIFELLPEEVSRLRRGRCKETARTGHPLHFEDVRHEMIIENSVYPLFDEAGAVDRLAVYGREITHHRAMEDALRSANERLRYLMSATTAVIYSAKPDGDLGALFISDSVKHVTGYEAGEFMNCSGIWLDNVHPEDRALVLAEARKVLTSVSHRCEYRFRRKDGTYMWVQDEFMLVRDDSGNPIEVVGFWTDVTARRRAEDDLRRNEERFRAIVESMPMPACIASCSDGAILYLNEHLATAVGCSVDEALGRKTWEFYADPGQRRQVLDELEAHGHVDGLEVELRRVDGTSVWMSMSAQPLVFEGKDASFATFVDMTERRDVEAQLRASEERLKTVLDTMQAGVVVVDANTFEIVDVNPVAAGMIGDEAANLLGRACRDVFSEDGDGGCPAKGKPSRLTSQEWTLLRADGQETRVLRSAVPVMISGREYIVESFVDITERKREEEKKLRQLYEGERALRQQLEEEMKRRVEYTRILTHELRTSLTSVLASSDLLVSELRDEPMLRLARNVNRSAANLDNRVSELLDLARGEVGMLELKLESVDAGRLLQEVVDGAAPIAARQGVDLSLSVPTSLPPLSADPARLQQVVGNLLNNALKFTARDGQIRITARQKQDRVVIEVRDTGRGMTKEQLARLFSPYQRQDAATHKSTGLGLGLPLCKTLVELHGGQIGVRSRPGRGSAFWFSIPMAAQAEREDSQDRARLWKVLIIEDDPEIVESVSVAFELRWPEAALISTRLGDEGVEMVETEEPDVVILDIALPDTHGLDVLRQIRLFSTVPVLMLSVKSAEEDIVGALEWGADDYITKPFRQIELIQRLKAHLRRQRPVDEREAISWGPLQLDTSTSQLRVGDREVSLTIIEGQIMECLMRRAGRVVPHAVLADSVWGEESTGVMDSLRVYIRRLREKVESDPRHPRLIVTKPGVGYLLSST